MLPLALFRDMWLKNDLKNARINKHYIKITMKIFNADEKRDGEINNLLQRIKYKISKSEPGSFVYFRLYTIKDGNKIEYKEKFSNVAVFEELKQLGAIEILSRDVDEINKSLKENKKIKKDVIMEEGYLVRPIEPKFSALCEKYEKLVGSNVVGGKPEYKNGVLYFKNKIIDFNDSPNRKELLDIIFEEPKKEWFYDEMLEKWDELKRLNLIKLPDLYWKKFDTAGIGINKCIAVETGIKDFIIKNSKKIRINPTYI